MTHIQIDAVNTKTRWVAATVTTDKGTKHRIGYIPAESGWFCCSCSKARTCPQIQLIKDLVPPMEVKP